MFRHKVSRVTIIDTPRQSSATTAPDARPALSPDGTERRVGGLEQRLNALRAGVLGANDGIVSTAAVVVGVAGATTSTGAIALAGIAAAVGGAVSMALGEYVSVSSQRDSEKHVMKRVRQALDTDPDAELDALAQLYEQRGISPQTSREVARQLSAQDALDAHLRERHNIDHTDVASPWHAALASFLAFAVGALLPLLAILLPGPDLRVPVTFLATLVGLALTGAVAASIGGGSKMRAAIRVLIGGALALGATYLIGSLLGTAGIV